jgi:hypothetical protein
MKILSINNKQRLVCCRFTMPANGLQPCARFLLCQVTHLSVNTQKIRQDRCYQLWRTHSFILLTGLRFLLEVLECHELQLPK